MSVVIDPMGREYVFRGRRWKTPGISWPYGDIVPSFERMIQHPIQEDVSQARDAFTSSAFWPPQKQALYDMKQRMVEQPQELINQGQEQTFRGLGNMTQEQIDTRAGWAGVAGAVGFAIYKNYMTKDKKIKNLNPIWTVALGVATYAASRHTNMKKAGLLKTQSTQPDPNAPA
jgi:hypothetical protein